VDQFGDGVKCGLGGIQGSRKAPDGRQQFSFHFPKKPVGGSPHPFAAHGFQLAASAGLQLRDLLALLRQFFTDRRQFIVIKPESIRHHIFSWMPCLAGCLAVFLQQCCIPVIQIGHAGQDPFVNRKMELLTGYLT